MFGARESCRDRLRRVFEALTYRGKKSQLCGHVPGFERDQGVLAILRILLAGELQEARERHHHELAGHNPVVVDDADLGPAEWDGEHGHATPAFFRIRLTSWSTS